MVSIYVTQSDGAFFSKVLVIRLEGRQEKRGATVGTMAAGILGGRRAAF